MQDEAAVLAGNLGLIGIGACTSRVGMVTSPLLQGRVLWRWTYSSAGFSLLLQLELVLVDLLELVAEVLQA